MASPFNQPAGGFGKPFSFGAPASTPGLFNTPTTTSFGAATGGFSAASSAAAPAFGAAATTVTPAFGAAPAFGAPSTPFGAATTPAASGFGAFSFGTAGAATSSASPFVATTAPFGSSSSSLFGASTATTFGSAAAPATTSFGFANVGGFGSPAPATGMFGSVAPAAGQPGGMFAPGAATQMAPVSFSSGSTPDAAVKEINEVRAAYTPSSSSFKFQHLLLNVVENPGSRVKPPNVDEIRWRQVLAQAGGPNNPDKLWPVLAIGFKDLLSRSSAQQQAIDENQARLKALTELAHRMSRQHTVELKGRTADVQKRHIELSNRLLHVTRLLDALESRLAVTLGYRGDASRSKEQELSRQLTSVEAEVAPHSATGLQRRLQAVSAAARLRSGCAAPAVGGAAQAQLDEKSLQQLFAVLKEHAEGVRQLQEVLKRDQLDVGILSRAGWGGATN